MQDMISRVRSVIDWLHVQAPGAQLSSDSRTVNVGDVFAAYPGDTADGRAFIAGAVERGARAVVYDDGDGFNWNPDWNVPRLPVSGLKRLAGHIASAYYNQPDRDMYAIAVTGTNGKTSCSQWLADALSQAGEAAAAIGTLGIALYERGAHGPFDVTGYTTPDAVLLQRKLAQLRDAGASAIAIEASSIGLDQGRLNGMHFDAALFTNFTRDHLDYHGDMGRYEEAKALLFDWPGLRHAVVNLDDDMGLRLVRRIADGNTGAAVIGYTRTGRTVDGMPILRASEIHSSNAGTTFQLDSPFGAGHIRTQLIGEFNVSNILGVAGVLFAKGISWQVAVTVLEELTAVPGRMQQLGGIDAPLVVIDYAHTPDALEKTLVTLREVARHRSGQLWCLFGCGGDRDPGKRPQMGAVAAMADHTVVTSDNPRSESPADIISHILQGMNNKTPSNAPQVIEDRAAAILWAVKHAARNDVILLAGKGHEAYQEIKGRKFPFLDADHAALALAARATMNGGH